MIIDTHSHCYFDDLKNKIDEIIANMQSKKVAKSIQIGCDIASSIEAVELAKKYPNYFYATIGFHPCEAKNYNNWRNFFSQKLSEFDNFDNFLDFLNSQNSDFWNNIFANIPEFVELEKIWQNNSNFIVAIGESGLDFHYLDGTDNGKKIFDRQNPSSKAKIEIENQKFFWLAQHKFALKYNIPLVIHSRDCNEETFDFMQKFQIENAVLHCYSGDWDLAEKFIKFSSKIFFGFGGALTYKKNIDLQNTASSIPVDRILIETDAPFLSPVPLRGQINESANTRIIFEFLSELRPENSEFLEEQIYQNSIKFFNLK